MFTQHEGFFPGHDGLTLFFQTWKKENSRGTVLITHGQGEHSDCYQRLVNFFKNDDWDFWGWDMRGHGRSEGKRGYASTFEDYVLDAHLFYRKAFEDARVKKGPVILLSHSMGGLVQLKCMIEKPDLGAKALVCSAPFLGIALEVPGWKDAGAKLINSIYPHLTLWNEIRNTDLTRDPDVIREFEQDVLRHDRISPGVFLGFRDAFSFVLNRAQQIKLPILLQLPEADPVVHTPTSQEFFNRIGSQNKVLKIYGDGAKHEMYNDIHRQEVYRDLKSFLDSVKGS